ncbi:sugar phosphate isomerase/epimerase [Rhodococcus fascians]|uniref:sugar phosphate isomerase/epimerase family protein n=1 Tax=Rhodococcoides fascians TaxID=1828 RepID=UPI00196152D9|nr:sugar phosphate isomerase/epimerase family protein [Rhodococcus fascians]MBM7245137.1 sugar phosphate isomerase/epimerase [Rhodococcus fascians]MBY3811114.1 sugar phosphate isomerase/epimerase [Rhodococcus fascians]MBY3842617.1 sugar phosphate isomerase/epimerase [Rhodococcus fascians]MBY3845526.1 sugar phosphate isomerase/epimerase [Rhodococcus fascians]MBY3851742.1 sugar phosphate isomerase/epimerase [Rhodococcus fascians]
MKLLPFDIENPYASLSLNTKTTNSWTLKQAVYGAARAGLGAVAPWRDRIQEAGVSESAKLISDAGLRVSSLCRGGFLTAIDDDGLDDNRRALDEAAELGAPELVMVMGGIPDRDLVGARARVEARLALLVPYALERGVRIALEPLHPMFAADRAVISTLGQALSMAEPHPVEAVGVVVDTFHVWWDPDLESLIRTAGDRGRISSYQVCDWLVPMEADPLLSRGMMGDGVIDFESIGRWIQDAGYRGDVEVEIFNAAVWATDGDQVIETMKQRYRDLVLPSLIA